MTKTAIAWATHHWEPVGGCTDASEGCATCYARERQLPRLSVSLTGRTSPPAVKERLQRYAGLVQKAPAKSERNYQWTGKMAFWEDRVMEPLSWKKPRQRVFVCSQSDLFHENRPDRDIAAVLATTEQCPQSTFLVLTKRAPRLLHWARSIALSGIQPNLWLGVSVENQARAEERIPLLCAAPAAKRFVSYEPALGPVAMGRWLQSLDWVIAGAESTHGKRPARPAEQAWFRALRDECQESAVPFFLKQMAVEGKIVDVPALDGRQWMEVPR